MMFPDPGNLCMVLHGHVCLTNFTDISEFGCQQIKGLRTQNCAWEPGLSDSAHPNYDEKSGSQLLLTNAL